MTPLLENWVAIGIITTIIIAIFRATNANIKDLRKEVREDLRKEMREDIGKLDKDVGQLRTEVREDIGKCNNSIEKLDAKLDAKFDKLHDLMMKYIIDPAAAKQEATRDAARQKESGPKPPSE